MKNESRLSRASPGAVKFPSDGAQHRVQLGPTRNAIRVNGKLQNLGAFPAIAARFSKYRVTITV